MATEILGGKPGEVIRSLSRSDYIGSSGTVGTATAHLRARVDPDQELKKIFQQTIMDECSDLFQRYDFRLVRLVAEQNFYKDCYSFAVAVMSPSVEGGNALHVTHDLSRLALYDSPNHYSTPSMACNPTFLHLFHRIARQLRHEIEKRTKEMPMAPYYQQAHTMTYTQNYDSGSVSATIPEKIVNQYNGVVAPKASKYKYIDALIADSKKRLVGHAKPKFEFKHFGLQPSFSVV